MGAAESAARGDEAVPHFTQKGRGNGRCTPTMTRALGLGMGDEADVGAP